MNKKIYSTKNHNISCSEEIENTFSLTINFLELSFRIDTYELVDAFGFFPLIKAKKTNISIPQYNKGEFHVRLLTRNINSGEIYNYKDVVNSAGVDFKNSSIFYDTYNKIICMGEIDFVNEAIMINNNIVCVVDKNEVLRCIYILFDEFE